jgi:hypothetical protein
MQIFIKFEGAAAEIQHERAAGTCMDIFGQFWTGPDLFGEISGSKFRTKTCPISVPHDPNFGLK